MQYLKQEIRASKIEGKSTLASKHEAKHRYKPASTIKRELSLKCEYEANTGKNIHYQTRGGERWRANLEAAATVIDELEPWASAKVTQC